MSKAYEVLTLNPITYLQSGRPINGWHITVRLSKYDEIIEFDVPKYDAKIIAEHVNEAIRERDLIDKLGRDE